jgi:hypothetical protein
VLEVGNLARVENAEAVEAGELFTYTLAEPLQLKARASALVPFLQRRVKAERITWIASAADAPRAGLRFVNSTEQTLPGGPLSVFSEGGFSGEATLERLKPNEQRVVQFGADMDVQLSEDTGPSSEQVKRLAFRNDSLEEHYLQKSERTYTLTNRGGQARTVNVGLELGANATAEGADAMDFDPSSGHPVAVFRVKPRSKLERTVRSVEGLSRHTALPALTSSRLKELAALSELLDADRHVAKEAADRQLELESSQERLGATVDAMKVLEQDITRLREHLRALGGEKGAGSAASDNPLVQRLLRAEDRLELLRKQQVELQMNQRSRTDALRACLARLSPTLKGPGSLHAVSKLE